jgi:predicted transcriptional regulator
LNITNISQFAKENNIDSNALYKVARGKIKSYKNLRLFNPLDEYKPSPDA